MTPRTESYRQRLEGKLLDPLSHTSKWYYAWLLFLVVVVAWGLYAYLVQLRYGLLATGMRDVVMWGFYIVNFVFFLGIAMAGTVISAILRVTGAAWRTPITRMAELITVAALMMGGLMPIIDLGRPDRILNVFIYGRFQSAIMWDILVITTYFVGSLIYLYLPLIPDLALMRDRLKTTGATLKQKVYGLFAVGWVNTLGQHQRLDKAIGIMSVTIIPMAVLTHTVASFIFSWTLRPGWDSTIYGIYFVIAAIFSGIATILIVMAVFRRLYHLEAYITEKHFRYLSYLMLTSLLIYLYLVVTEYLTVGYKLEGQEKDLLTLLMLGKDAVWFWFFIIAGIVIPFFLIVIRRGPTIPRIVTAAVLVNVAMWVKRFVIVIPSVQVPLMPFEFGTYTPTWVEWSITAASFAGFMLILAVAAKLIPIISVWEVAGERETASSQIVEVASKQSHSVAERE